MTQPLRIALVYDRVFPESYGGVERWFRLLAESLTAAGHTVTYLTAAHWESPEAPHISGVPLICLTKVNNIYDGERRSVRPVVTFGAAVARYLRQHPGAFDVVHCTSSSPAAAFAAVTAARIGNFAPVLDWWEVWGAQAWKTYMGTSRGILAARLELHLARSRHVPVTYSQLHGQRLAHLRQRDDALQIRGVLPSLPLPSHLDTAQPYVLLTNRLIPEKQTSAILPALSLARKLLPSLRAVIVGSGPLASELQADIARLELTDAVTLLSSVPDEELATLMQNALCLALLSRREGFGLVTVEAMRYGTPALVLNHADSAASERISVDENGILLQSIDPETLASAILQLHTAGKPFRERTLAWRKRRDSLLTIDHSLPFLISRYEEAVTERRAGGWRIARR